MGFEAKEFHRGDGEGVEKKDLSSLES